MRLFLFTSNSIEFEFHLILLHLHFRGSHRKDDNPDDHSTDVESQCEYDEDAQSQDVPAGSAVFDSDDDGNSAATLQLLGDMGCDVDSNNSEDDMLENDDDNTNSNHEEDCDPGDGDSERDNCTTPAPRRAYIYKKHGGKVSSPAQKRRRILQKHASEASDASRAY